MGWPFKGKKEQKPETESLMTNGSGAPQPQDISFPPIPGLDTVKGIAMTGGTSDGYRQVLTMFRKDAEERLQKFRFFLYEGLNSGTGKFPEKHLQSLTTQIQALKSASATIGAAELSAEAAQLEAAGKEKNFVFIYDKLPDYIEHLSDLVKNVRSALEQKQGENDAVSGGHRSFMQMFGRQKSDKTASAKTDISEYLDIFNKLKEALTSQNVLAIEHVLDELNQKPLDSKIREVMEQISDQVLMTEFDSAIKTIDDLISTNG